MKPHGAFRAKDVWGRRFINHQSAFSFQGRTARAGHGPFKMFALVRNPWERAVSLYFGRDKFDTHSPKKFHRYMETRSSSGSARWNPFYLQTNSFTPDTLVFQLDKIEELYAWLEKEFAINITERPHRKTGKNRRAERLPYQDYHNKLTRKLIYEAHHRDIERFGWKF